MKLQEVFEKYSDGNGGGDKGNVHSYIEVYEKEITKLSDVDLLEIGVWQGHSLAMWQEYFSDSRIIGLDVDLSRCIFPVDARLCDATNPIMLDEVLGDEMFDYVIDDGSHILEHQVESFVLLWERMKPNGKYFIEDIDNDDALQFITDVMDELDIFYKVYDLRHIKNRWDDLLVVTYAS